MTISKLNGVARTNISKIMGLSSNTIHRVNSRSFLDRYVVSMLHMNGADASTIFTDETGKTWTANGNAQIDTAQSKLGGASGFFDGTGDSISTPDHDDFTVADGNFTIELWVRRASVGTTLEPYFFHLQNGSNYFGFFREVATNLLVCEAYIGAAYVWRFRCAFNPSNAVWYHLAAVRNGNTPLLFIDGINQTVTQDTTISGKTEGNIAGSAYIAEYNTSLYFNGHIDEFRFSKGICRFPANFTPSTEEY